GFRCARRPRGPCRPPPSSPAAWLLSLCDAPGARAPSAASGTSPESCSPWVTPDGGRLSAGARAGKRVSVARGRLTEAARSPSDRTLALAADTGTLPKAATNAQQLARSACVFLRPIDQPTPRPAFRARATIRPHTNSHRHGRRGSQSKSRHRLPHQGKLALRDRK